MNKFLQDEHMLVRVKGPLHSYICKLRAKIASFSNLNTVWTRIVWEEVLSNYHSFPFVNPIKYWFHGYLWSLCFHCALAVHFVDWGAKESVVVRRRPTPVPADTAAPRTVTSALVTTRPPATTRVRGAVRVIGRVRLWGRGGPVVRDGPLPGTKREWKISW